MSLREKNNSIVELKKTIEVEKEVKKSAILEEENDKLRFDNQESERCYNCTKC